jgi:hypothetical protein
MHFSLVKIRPFLFSDCFDDVLPMRHALSSLGFAVEMLVNDVNPRSTNIIFGANKLQGELERRLPRGSIIFNLEQFTAGSRWTTKAYARRLMTFPVWDYSPRNIAWMKDAYGIDAVLVRLGYVPEMTHLDRDSPRDIDVLFYGSMNERREQAIAALQAAGVRVTTLNWIFGRERDQAISRAKCILNVHYYTPASLEVARLGYLFANRRAVVSERGPEDEVYPELDDACRFCRYEDLTCVTQDILTDDALRVRQEERAFAAFASLDFAHALEAVVGKRKVHGAGMDGAPDLPHPRPAGSEREATDARSLENGASPGERACLPLHG